MNTKDLLLLTLAAALGISFHAVNAQSVTTEPVGFMTDSLLSDSDTHISLPLIRPPAFVGGIQSVSGTAIAVSGNPWMADQFVYAAGSQPNHYYALIGPASSVNPKEGRTYPIVSNTTNSITVDLGPDNLAGIPANAQLSVIPNWSLKTVFPASDAGVSFTPTTSAQYKTQVRVPDVSATGINLPTTTYYFSNNATPGQVGWRLVGDDTTDRGDDPLLPDSHIVVRNLNGAPTLPLVNLGSVLLKKVTTPLLTKTDTRQDNPGGLLRPLDVSLNATGLNRADGSFGPNDQLLLFDNSVAGFDKAPSATYVQTAAVNGPWRRLGDRNTDRGSDIIPAGAGFIVRKAVSDGQPDFWTNSFPVQATSAVSRKVHGMVGAFDLPLSLGGISTIEPRNNGGTHQIVFTFPEAVTCSGATVTSGTAATVSPSSPAANVVVVDLIGVPDRQSITVTLLDVDDGKNTNNVAARLRVIAGDVNRNDSVNSSDISDVKKNSSQALTALNFLTDLDVNGVINSTDITIAKSKSGSVLPDSSATQRLAPFSAEGR